MCVTKEELVQFALQNSSVMIAPAAYVLLSVLLYTSDGQRRVFDLAEYDNCNERGWICQKLQNCPAALKDVKLGLKPEICSFDNLEPIVCCDVNFSEDRKSDETKSSKMCSMYTNFFCYLSAFGGTRAKAREFPHMALIGYGQDPDQISWQCGGSLISERYVLSAAHCTFPSTTIGTANYVRVGDLNTATDTDDAEPQQFTIVERINHPGYKPPAVYNDIALYKLDRDVRFGHYVKPLCLHENHSIPEDPVIATGWGRIEFAGPLSTHLLKVSITPYAENECKSLWNSSSQLPRGIDASSMICAGERDGSRDTCQGDSGGPLILDWKHRRRCLAAQVGITSFGRLCGLPDSPGVYTRVAPYVSWIESIVWAKDI